MDNYLLEMIQNDNIFWTKGDGNSADVVLSTRIRLARNYKEYPFSTKINEQQSRELLDNLRSAMVKEKDLYFFDLSLFPEALKLALFEKQLISKELAAKNFPTGLILNKENGISIMVNEEDHLRIQAYTSGLDFKTALEKAIAKDDFFSTLGNYSFDPELGFHTSCLTNFGTGLRASVMVHIPGITELGFLPKLNWELQKSGYTLRGMYGEGTESWGGFFQISNQLTTGISEEEIIQRITKATENLVNQEREARNQVARDKKLLLEDKVFRAWGLLTNARILTHKEAILNISMLRMGINEKIIGENSVNHQNLNLSTAGKLILYSSENYLKALEAARAEKIREILNLDK